MMAAMSHSSGIVCRDFHGPFLVSFSTEIELS